jgi:hypothetical protein
MDLYPILSLPGAKVAADQSEVSHEARRAVDRSMSPLDPRPSWVRQRTYELQLTGMRWVAAREQAEAEADDKFGAEDNDP